jgi:hypothetical protein
MDANETKSDVWFAPWRFGLFLGLAIVCAFPKVALGFHTFFYRDFGVLAYPMVFFHHESFWRGEWPLWNPLSNCGAPFLAQWGTMALYPFSLFYLLLPLPWSLNFFCLAHLFWAGLGMYFLAFRWTENRLAASVAGVAFVFNGVTLSCLSWPNYTAALGWMPWVVLWVGRAWREGGRTLIVAALTATMQLLAGVPEIVLLTWLLILGVWTTDFHRAEIPIWLRVARPAGIVVLVSGLSAAQLFPFFDLLAQSQRSAEFATAKWSMPVWGWANLVFPLFRCFLTPQGVFFQIGQEFMTSTYLGITALLLAIFAVCRTRERRVWLIAGLTLFSLMMALGENGFLYRWIKEAVPLMGFARYPIKLVVLAAFAVPLLAAFTLKWIQREDRVDGLKEATPGELRISRIARMSSEQPTPPEASPRPSAPSAVVEERTSHAISWRILLLLASGLLITVGLLLEFTRRFPTMYDHWRAVLQCGIWRGAFLVASAGLLFALGRVERYWQCAAGFGLLSLIIADALTHVPKQNPTLPAYALASGLFELQNKTPAPKLGEGRVMISPHAEQHLLLSRVPDLHSDLLGKRLALWSNLNLLDGVPKVNGSSTLQIREQAEVQSLLYASTNTALPRLADFLGVSLATAPGRLVDWSPRSTSLPWVTGGQRPVYADAAAALRGLTNANFNPVESVFLPSEAQPFVSVTNRSEVRIDSRRFTNQRIDLETEAKEASLIVIAQSFYPAWRAYVDGQRTRLWRANHAFQALEVPAGRHRISLAYEEPSLKAGALISLLTMLASVCGWFRRFAATTRA